MFRTAPTARGEPPHHPPHLSLYRGTYQLQWKLRWHPLYKGTKKTRRATAAKPLGRAPVAPPHAPPAPPATRPADGPPAAAAAWHPARSRGSPTGRARSAPGRGYQLRTMRGARHVPPGQRRHPRPRRPQPLRRDLSGPADLASTTRATRAHQSPAAPGRRPGECPARPLRGSRDDRHRRDPVTASVSGRSPGPGRGSKGHPRAPGDAGGTSGHPMPSTWEPERPAGAGRRTGRIRAWGLVRWAEADASSGPIRAGQRAGTVKP